jgi:hypothetical protein
MTADERELIPYERTPFRLRVVAITRTLTTLNPRLSYDG